MCRCQMGFFRKKKSCLGYLWKIRRGRRVNVVGIQEGVFQNLRGFNVKKWNSRKGEGVMIKPTGNPGSQLQQKIHIFDMVGRHLYCGKAQYLIIQ